ncbi:hypothetical protein DY000_02007558 [Brassica cretica]|uniref:Uncharacterized protein n=1 Tax=Brassica cretica TaxID=69181 RepID=A0ABQ7C2B2_BRACR|nr:hypothetical protein DY000_02007558 [Brassica cretica]
MLEAPDNRSRTTKHQSPTHQTGRLDRASPPTRQTGELDRASRQTGQIGDLDRTRCLNPILVAPSSVIGSNRLLFRLEGDSDLSYKMATVN